MRRLLLWAVCLLALIATSEGQHHTSADFQNCDLDGCAYAIVQGKSEFGRNDTGRLIELDILNGRADFDDPSGKLKDSISWDDRPRKTWAFCSLLYPVIMIEEPAGASVKVLNFGTYGVSNTYLPHAKLLLYACNDVLRSEPTSAMTRQFGYQERPDDSEKLESMIRTPTDILTLTRDKAPR